jgi:hypothetical protein
MNWPNLASAVRYYRAEGFRVFNAQCERCGFNTMVVCTPERLHDLRCDNCKAFDMQPYEELLEA